MSFITSSQREFFSSSPNSKYRIGIIQSCYYKDIASELLKGAIACLDNQKYDVFEVAGCLEIPIALELILNLKKDYFDAFVVLGTVIRGETSHYDIVSQETARGVMDVSLRHKIPIGNAILTVENVEQAWKRAKITEGNKGQEAILAVFSVLKIKNNFIRDMN